MAHTGSGDLEGFVTESGALSQILPKFDLDSLCGVSKLIADRETIAKWTEENFIAAEFVMYTIEDNEAIAYLGKEHNPIFNNLKDAVSQLENFAISSKHGGGYIPSPEEIGTVKRAPTTLRVKISDLMLQEQKMEEAAFRYTFYYFDIPTTGCDKLSPAQAAFATMALRQLDELNKEGFRILRIYVSSPKSIKECVKEGSALVRPVTLRLGGSKYAIHIHANGQDIGHHHHVYGTKLPPGNEVFVDAYKTILANPTAALTVMTPSVAMGLSSLLNAYHTLKK